MKGVLWRRKASGSKAGARVLRNSGRTWGLKAWIWTVNWGLRLGFGRGNLSCCPEQVWPRSARAGRDNNHRLPGHNPSRKHRFMVRLPALSAHVRPEPPALPNSDRPQPPTERAAGAEPPRRAEREVGQWIQRGWGVNSRCNGGLASPSPNQTLRLCCNLSAPPSATLVGAPLDKTPQPTRDAAHGGPGHLALHFAGCTDVRPNRRPESQTRPQGADVPEQLHIALRGARICHPWPCAVPVGLA